MGGNQLLLSQVLQSAVDAQPPVTLAKIVLQLNGTVSKVCSITLIKLEISESSGDTPGSFRQKESPPAKTFLRGDANGNGQIDRDDALFIAELIVGSRVAGEGAGQVRRIQGAGASHDGDLGDKLDVADVLVILQHIVQLRDQNLN